jgi:hypothetical protein
LMLARQGEAVCSHELLEIRLNRRFVPSTSVKSRAIVDRQWVS